MAPDLLQVWGKLPASRYRGGLRGFDGQILRDGSNEWMIDL
jgi:hypothetical protein